MFRKLLYFALWSSVAWNSYSLQINLQKTEERLDPLLEYQIFQHHPQPPSEYEVLRGHPIRSERSSGNEDESYDPNPSTVTFSVPVNGTDLRLFLHKVNIAHPELTLEFPNEGEGEDSYAEFRVNTDCFYSGGDENRWAIVSTCTGVNGIITVDGNSFQLEQIIPEGHEESYRYKRGTLAHIFVTYPIRTKKNFEPEDLGSPLLSEMNRPVAEFESNPVEGAVGGRGHRVRRRTVKSYTVELAVFVDSTLYTYVQKRFPNSDERIKTLEIVMTLVNAVHRMYSDASLGDNKVGMLVKKVEVLKADKPSHSKGDIYKYLKNFCKWQSGQNPKRTSGHWDHALLLSGHDLWNEKPSQNSTVGLAFVGGMCTSDYSCTINEATTFAAAFIIAHEMGHNFNMKHDGSNAAAKCSANSNIMSPVMASGATKWSSCSKSSLSSFLKSRGGCLTDRNTATVKDGERTHEGEPPGKRFDAGDQCFYMYGKGWNHFATTEYPFNNVCREIWCRKGRLLKTPSASALEGTPCGKDKACSHGICKAEEAKKSVNKGGEADDKITKVTKPKDDDDDDHDDSGNILNITPSNDDGKDDEKTTPKTCISKKDDCDTYTKFLGSMFSSETFLGGIFNKIFKAVGLCDDECKR